MKVGFHFLASTAPAVAASAVAVYAASAVNENFCHETLKGSLNSRDNGRKPRKLSWHLSFHAN